MGLGSSQARDGDYSLVTGSDDGLLDGHGSSEETLRRAVRRQRDPVSRATCIRRLAPSFSCNSTGLLSLLLTHLLFTAFILYYMDRRDRTPGCAVDATLAYCKSFMPSTLRRRRTNRSRSSDSRPHRPALLPQGS